MITAQGNRRHSGSTIQLFNIQRANYTNYAANLFCDLWRLSVSQSESESLLFMSLQLPCSRSESLVCSQWITLRLPTVTFPSSKASADSKPSSRFSFGLTRESEANRLSQVNSLGTGNPQHNIVSISSTLFNAHQLRWSAIHNTLNVPTPRNILSILWIAMLPVRVVPSYPRNLCY